MRPPCLQPVDREVDVTADRLDECIPLGTHNIEARQRFDVFDSHPASDDHASTQAHPPTGLNSAAVAQAGGNAVDGQVDAALHELCLVAVAPPTQQ